MDATAELAARQRIWFRAVMVRLDLPAGSVFLTDGGFVIWDSAVYYGNHPVLGVLAGVSGLTNGMVNQTSRVDINILPRDMDAVAILADAANQGSRIRVWRGVIDFETGLIVGAATLRFDGEIDKPRYSVGSELMATIECGTQSARLLEPNADWRQNDAFHRRRWPGEDGLINVSGVVKQTRKLEWRP
ncbi:hypothetical protein [Brevundimonas sp. FT23028]|uniref:hypothetical protein n=1 Tax=Brevundimonas sp. FT23028 TaxID=3393748 RepID=UPI003B588FD8